VDGDAEMMLFLIAVAATVFGGLFCFALGSYITRDDDTGADF
jgi:fluoride ion exporter CrcB/FEX